MKKNIYTGLITALITPFENGKLDFRSLEKLISLQINSGVHGLVVGGSTGEGSSLSEDDYYELIKTAQKIADKRIPIIAGITTVSTDYALLKIAKLNQLDIDGLMCTPPQYIRPEQNGLFEHFKAVNDATDLPIILYSHQGRTGVDFSDDTIIKLSKLSNIIALKDAGSDIERPLRLLSSLPTHFHMLTGDDGKVIAYTSHGGRGLVSVVSNILPSQCLLLQNYLHEGNYTKALILQQKLVPLYHAIFRESNPIGIKCAASLLNLCWEEMKLPLTIARKDTRSLIKKNLSLILL